MLRKFALFLLLFALVPAQAWALHEVMDHPAVQGGVALLIGAVLTTAAAYVRSLFVGDKIDREAANRAAEKHARDEAERLMRLAVLAVEERASTARKEGRPFPAELKKSSALEAFHTLALPRQVKLSRHEAVDLLDATIAALPGVGATGKRVHLAPAD